MLLKWKYFGTICREAFKLSFLDIIRRLFPVFPTFFSVFLYAVVEKWWKALAHKSQCATSNRNDQQSNTNPIIQVPKMKSIIDALSNGFMDSSNPIESFLFVHFVALAQIRHITKLLLFVRPFPLHRVLPWFFLIVNLKSFDLSSLSSLHFILILIWFWCCKCVNWLISNLICVSRLICFIASVYLYVFSSPNIG